MNTTLQRIEESVRNYLNKDANPSIIDLREGILWFDRMLNYNCGVKDLDGINITLLDAIEDLYIRKGNARKALIVIATETETYLEKIVYLVTGNDYTGNSSMTLINMMEVLNLSEALNNRNCAAADFFTESQISSFVGSPDFIEHLARTYVKRNDITHNSPSYDIADTYVIARSFLVTMLYATIRHIQRIKEVINADLTNLNEQNNLSLIDEKTTYLYNFISHGKANWEIKEQLIEAYILHSVYKNSGIKVDNLVLSCNDNFNTNFSKISFERELKKLERKSKITLEGDIIQLADEEKKSLDDEIEYFTLQEQLFKQNIAEILSKFYASDKTDTIYTALNRLIESNYRIDLSELFQKVINNGNVTLAIKSFKRSVKNVLKSKGHYSQENLLELVLDLLSICYSNDFLYRKCAAVIYSDINNQNGLQSYLRQLEREVYLDTNVLLFVMCRYYQDVGNCSIPEYNVIRELLNHSRQNKSIILQTSSEYLYELAYQVRAALLLIPFEEVGFFKDGYSSNNVFYRFYIYLKDNELLEEDVNTLEDFLEGFDFMYNDLYVQRPLKNLSNICSDILIQEGITIKTFEKYEEGELSKNFSKICKEPRSAKTISNDVQMIAFLSDKGEHSLDPYFVTYDSSFIKMREYVFENIKRYQFWHLYFPSRFVAHLNMINFRIDAKNFTDDFISILSKSNFMDSTATLADIMSDFMDIKSESKRKLIRLLKEFNAQYSSSIDSEANKQDERSAHHPVGELLKKISYHYKKSDTKHNLMKVKRLILNPEKTEEISRIFDVALKEYSIKKKFDKSLFAELEKLLGDK